MVTLPADTPVTTPLLFTVAIAVLLLLQVPPDVTSANVMVELTQTLDEPVIAATTGNAFTVIDFVALAVPQLVTVYFMVADPAATPVTTPVPELTVATAVLLLLQVPPLLPLLVNVVVEPTQTVVAPLIVPAFAAAFTVIDLVTVVVHPPLVFA